MPVPPAGTLQVTLFVPSVDREGQPFDQEYWRGAALRVFRGNVADKWEGHQINTAHFIRPARTMHTIGG